ncbi:MAG: GGDEF domain-containing protein [Azoarcus sp.]|jgi:diguanylate cyclase (GGDEF)-like protein|nr:GGDEF domain-containing protein [Azoarcus sp.]
MVYHTEKTLNFKVSLFFIFVSIILVGVLTGITFYAFRIFSVNTATEHLRTAAEIVRVHLTESMITGIIDQRQSFLKRLAEVQNLKSVRVIRSPIIDSQFGDERKGEFLPDKIESQVLETGQPAFEVIEENGEAIFRGTIPYVASNEGIPNCLQCHAAKSGDVLGAVTMTMSVTGMRHNGLITAANIIGVVIIAILVLFVLLYYLLLPISDTARAIKYAVKDAIEGNFRNEIAKKTNDEIGQIASDISRLLKFLNDGLNKMNEYISHLIHRRQNQNENILLFTIDMVKNLTQLSQYKASIEEDDSKHEVYCRLITTLNNRFFLGKCDFSIYEVSDEGNELRPILFDEKEDMPCRWCQKKILTDPQNCRVFHTGHMINSVILPDVCRSFKPEGTPDTQADEDGDEDILAHRQQLERAQIQQRLRRIIQGQRLVSQSNQPADNEASGPELHYTLCLPIRKSGTAVGGIIQLVIEEKDKERALAALPYIESYINDTAPVIEVRRLMETLRDSTLRDALTGLNNRRFLEEYIDTLTASTRRKQTHIAIMMLDLDHFKIINDTYGHDAGDTVLKALAGVIKSSVRASDIVVRYGGEEFMAILQDTTSTYAVGVAEKIRIAVEMMQIPHNGIILQRTISIGVADFPGDSHTFWQTVKYADVALYNAKESGRNRVVHFTHEMWKDKSY